MNRYTLSLIKRDTFVPQKFTFSTDDEMGGSEIVKIWEKAWTKWEVKEIKLGHEIIWRQERQKQKA